MSPRLLLVCALVIIDVYATEIPDITKDGYDNIVDATNLHNEAVDVLQNVLNYRNDRDRVRQTRETHHGKTILETAFSVGMHGLEAYIFYKHVFKGCLMKWQECKAKIKAPRASIKNTYLKLVENVKWIKTKLMSGIDWLLNLAKSFLTDLSKRLAIGTSYAKSAKAVEGAGSDGAKAAARTAETTTEEEEGAGILEDILEGAEIAVEAAALAETPSGDMEEMTRLVRILQRGAPRHLPPAIQSPWMLAVGAAIAGLCVGLWLSCTFAPQTRHTLSQEMLLG